MKKILQFLIFLLPISLFLAGCGATKSENTKDSGEAQQQLTVYTTVYPLQFFAEKIGGNAVQVKTIYPPGADEHTFEPSQKDMMEIADSDLFVYVGLGLEGFVDAAKDTLKNEHVAMLAAGENIKFTDVANEHNSLEDPAAEEHSNNEDTDQAHDEANEEHAHGEANEEHAHGDIDPHVWLDPVYSNDMAVSIKDAFIKLMPEKEAQFEKNYLALSQQLDDLNTKYKETINSSEQKEIIVSHAAYGYWEKRYGLKQISISGLSTSSEPSQKELENIISTAKEHNIAYIFYEQNTSSKLTEIVEKEIDAKPLVLHNLSVLTDGDVKKERDYISIMTDNLEALNKALD